MSSWPSVVVVILNWNKAQETLACLEALLEASYPIYSVLVVDNGSMDDSVKLIYDRFPEIKVIETGVNLGYAEGNNVGIQWAIKERADYIFILNNDVRVAPDVLEHLVEAAERFPEAGFLGPKIYHLEKPEHLQSAGAELDKLWGSHQRGLDMFDSGLFSELEEVDYVIGAAVLVRSRLIDEIGMLDPDYFLYREDVDWCLRARRRGYKVLYVPQAKVWHRSHHVRESELPRTTYYLTRNSLMLLKKQKGGFSRFCLVLVRHLRTALSWTIKPRWRSKRTERDALVKGVIDYFRGKVGFGYE